MAQFLFRLPDVGEGVAEAEITVWHVKEGDRVGEDESLVDVMTDKATVDMTSPVDGVVKKLHGAVGDMVPVGSVLVELEVEGAEEAATEATDTVQCAAPAESPEPGPDAKDPLPPAAPEAVASPSPIAEGSPAHRRAAVRGDAPTHDPAQPPLAAPATRRRAKELGIDLANVKGSGPAGRILPQDLESHAMAPAARPSAPTLDRRDGVEAVKIIGLRRRIAEKMQEAKRRIPHIAYIEEVEVTELEKLRAAMNAERGANGPDRPKLTILPFLMRAMVRAIADFPQMNARFDDDAGVLDVHEGVHIGIATQTDGGLMVPVVRHAEARDIWGCAAEVARVSTAAREGSATREELAGSTITITSLGTLGGIATTPVINHPEVAIVGPNKIVDRPVFEGDMIRRAKMMNISSSFDHRIIDGYDAAQFVQRLKRLLEHPALIFVD